MNPKTIFVVGGGIAGLTAAYRLAKFRAGAASPFRVVVLESEPTVGGQARAFRMDGVTVENGSHIFFDFYDTLLNLIGEFRKDAALAATMPDLVRCRGFVLTDAYGRTAHLKQSSWLPHPLNVVPSLFGVPWLSWRDKLGTLKASLTLMRTSRRKYDALDGRTSFDHALKTGYSFQGAMTWDGAALGLTSQFLRDQSAAAFAAMHALLLGQPCGLKPLLPAGDLSALFADPAKKAVEALGGTIKTGVTVEGVESGGASSVCRLLVRQNGGPLERMEADYAILALPPRVIQKIAPWVKGSWTELMPVAPVITLVMGLSGKIDHAFGHSEIGCSRDHWVFSVLTDLSSFWPEFRGNKTVIRAEIGHADLLPDGAQTDDAALALWVKRDLDRLFPSARGMNVEWVRVHRETKHLYTAWAKGQFSKRIDDIRIAPRIIAAGDWTTILRHGMGPAADSGTHAANRILQDENFPPYPVRDIPLPA